MQSWADRWYEAVKDQYKEGSAKRRKLCINQLKPFFAKVPLKSIGFSQCEKWLRDRASDLSESSFNQELDTLKMIFEFGITQGVLIDNPARDIKRRKMRKAVVVVPTREQFSTLVTTLRNAGARMQPIWLNSWHFRVCG